MLALGLVDLVVDDSGNTPHLPSVAEGHEIDSLAEIERGVLAGRQGGHVVADQRRHIAVVALVEVNLN